MILDCDLLVGRDIASGRRRTPAELAQRLAAAGIDGGAVTSLRAIAYDPKSGNREGARAAAEHGWIDVPGVELRNPLDAHARLERIAADGHRLVRFATTRQNIPGTAPRLRMLARRATELGLTLLVEGSTRTVGLALMGLGASVVLLDQHFYDAGEFIMVAREEPGFHASTRLLGNLDAWESITAEVGADRLLFGTRAGWFEEHSVLERLHSSGLSPEQRALVTSGNLRRLAGERS
ncbi:hypothetical protein [Brachybacterium sp.]|uniref:hypothetical protein n=1 Tax=unclassified Brachybacterium TaxID=2623841 RepID=UPI003F9B2A2A